MKKNKTLTKIDKNKTIITQENPTLKENWMIEHENFIKSIRKNKKKNQVFY